MRLRKEIANFFDQIVLCFVELPAFGFMEILLGDLNIRVGALLGGGLSLGSQLRRDLRRGRPRGLGGFFGFGRSRSGRFRACGRGLRCGSSGRRGRGCRRRRGGGLRFARWRLRRICCGRRSGNRWRAGLHNISLAARGAERNSRKREREE